MVNTGGDSDSDSDCRPLSAHAHDFYVKMSHWN